MIISGDTGHLLFIMKYLTAHLQMLLTDVVKQCAKVHGPLVALYNKLCNSMYKPTCTFKWSASDKFSMSAQ